MGVLTMMEADAEGGEAEVEERVNPLAGMGLSDEQYSVILRNVVNGEGIRGGMGMGMGYGEKRAMEDDGDGDVREGKRGRFEVVE